MKQRPSDLEDHLGFWLRKLSNAVSGTFAARLERHDVSVPVWVVLRVLYDHSTLALKEIGARIGVDQGALSRMVERLVVRGLVLRSENPRSRREVAISLTEKGRKLVPKLAREADQNDQEFFGHLSDAQQQAFLGFIKTLLAANGQSANSVPLG